ncbi:MAG: hypothetical protein PHT32_01000 [Candidatus Omnitrophica bacterium]|nr:hypothetical protein [Candidatus Omnitrophota bacterium]
MQNAVVKMGRNERGGRIFAAALLISLVWHIFWLSAVKIVAASKEYGPVKFSKVSFLGPILESGSVEMRVAPKSRSPLEQKPMNMLPKDYYA